MIEWLKCPRKYLVKYMVMMLMTSWVLSGCGSVSEEDESLEGNMSPRPMVSDESMVTVESGENSDEVEDSEESEQEEWLPELSIKNIVEKWYGMDSVTVLVRCQYPEVRLSGERYEDVSKLIENWFEQEAEYCMETAQEYAWLAEADEAEGIQSYYEVELNAVCTRMDSRVISFRVEYNGFLPESFSGYTGVSFNLEEKQVMELEDILVFEKDFWQKSKEYVLHYLEENYGDILSAEYKEYFLEDRFKPTWNWYLNAEGICFMFQPYELADGIGYNMEVTLPYWAVEECMEEPYRGLCGVGMAQIPKEAMISVSLSQSGVTEDTLRIFQVPAPDGYMSQVCVEINGKVHELDEYCDSVMSSYVIRRANGKTYLLFDTECLPAEWSTCLYEVTDGEVHKTADIEGYIAAANIDSVQVRPTVEVFTTFWPRVWFSLEESGELVQREWLYEVEDYDYEYRILTLTREMPVTVHGHEDVLPEGTRLWITATDDNGTAWFLTLPFGQEVKNVEGEIHYTQPDGGEIFIDGISQFDYFEMLGYSG
ncbi:MAG: DUF3298 domain-containing protein [Lachnospiraceae bacterium]|nr:DUF3298 domain-containing protein [Lachnospiraceae bacterium]